MTKHKRGKYLRGADGKRSSLECYAQLDPLSTLWMMDIRDMNDDDEDDIIQAICDFTHAYYHATDDQRPDKFKEAYETWKKENAPILKKPTARGFVKERGKPLSGSSPQSSTLEYPPSPETK